MKKIKFAWIVELALFIVGFYIVYHNFLDESPAEETAVSEKQVAASGLQTTLESAVVCIDVDEDNVKPLLAKESFSKYIDYLYCFSRVSGPRPKAVFHYWIYDDNVVVREKASVDKATGAAWSKATMSPDKKGKWRVDIRLDDSQLLGSTAFNLN